jgi:ribonuclease J
MRHIINEVLQTNQKRVIFSTFSSDLSRIQNIINISVENNRRIAIIGRKAQKIVNIAMNSGYLAIPNDRLVNLKYIDDKNTNDDKDLVVIVTGTRHEPFYMLQRMCRQQDRLISIKADDQVVIVTPPVPGTERMAARTIDILYKNGAKVLEVNKSNLKSSHADPDDLKMLYSMLNPKYIVPIIGEYRHQYTQKNIAVHAGFSEEKVIILENGEVANFIDGEYTKSKETVANGDVLVDGSMVGDINEIVLRDREMLAQEGLVIVTIAVNQAQHRIVSDPVVVSKGLIISDSLDIINDNVAEITYNILSEALKKNYIDWSAVKSDLHDKISKKLYGLTKKNPIIMPTIINITQ